MTANEGPDQTTGRMFGAGETVETFMGLPKGAPGDPAKGAILGVPGVTPYGSVGAYCADGPAAIRAAIAGYAPNLTHVDFDAADVKDAAPMVPEAPNVIDCGDLAYESGDFAANRAAVRGAVQAMLAAGSVPILLGGDDSLPIPMLEAYAGHGPITILQIDAHIDWRDEVQGERLGLSSGMRRASEMGHVERIIQVGMRAIGSARPADVEDALAWGATLVPARRVAREGVWPVVDLIPEGAQVVVCLDADGLDPSIVPGVIGRAPGGLGYWDVVNLIEGAATRGRLVGFEVAEFMAARDVDGIGALNIARIVANVVRLAAKA
ncbi:MAG: arginase family protein [Pseudomonadota bacterium]